MIGPDCCFATGFLRVLRSGVRKNQKFEPPIFLHTSFAPKKRKAKRLMQQIPFGVVTWPREGATT